LTKNVHWKLFLLAYFSSYYIFVRSWLRKVVVTTDTYQENGQLHINKIKGQFSDDTVEITQAIVKFLLISHSIGEIFPSPLPNNLLLELKNAGTWAMSMYGNMAHVGTFDSNFEGSTKSPIRSLSLLHIAAARNDLQGIDSQIESGIPIDIIAADGLAPLHWSLESGDLQATQYLIELGANPDIRTIEGVTPMMNAVQLNNMNYWHPSYSYESSEQFMEKKIITQGITTETKELV
jgi:hypothetical protein